jgi:hypothetical protein
LRECTPFIVSDRKLGSLSSQEAAQRIEHLFSSTKELESQPPSSRTEMQGLKQELRKKLRKYRTLSKENAEGSWTEQVLDLFSSRRSSKRCHRHSKRVGSVQTEANTSVMHDVGLSPIRVYHRENSTCTEGIWRLPVQDSPESDLQMLDELPSLSSRQSFQQTEASLKQTATSLKAHLEAAVRASNRRTVSLHLSSEDSQPASSARSNVSLATYAQTPPRPIFNSEADKAVVVELRSKHSEYAQVTTLMERNKCSLVNVRKTYTFSLQRAMQQSWQRQSLNASISTSEARLFFYIAPVLLLEKIFKSPKGFASVFLEKSPVVLTESPSGETHEMICLAMNATKQQSKWQTEAQYILPVYLVEYVRH